MTGEALLEVADVHCSFGGVRAVDGVSLGVPPGAIAGLIGPNGAGKTTLLNLITGQYRPDRGHIRFGGTDIAGRRPHAVAALGVARTFQNIRLYRGMSAIDNVIAGMHVHRPGDTVTEMLRLPSRRAHERDRLERARDLMALVGLDADRLAKQPAGTLAYGDQRRLEIARGLALQPRLLLLDEPAAGMNPAEKSQMKALLRQLNEGGLTILLIDHDIKLVLGTCDSITVLNFGRRIAAGPAEEISKDPAVIEAYLGTSDPRPAATPARARPAGTTEPAEALLHVEGLAVDYGPVRAVHEVSLQVGPGEIVALIGPNGAGKSTVLNTLSGLLRPAAGSAVFDGLEVTRASSQRIVGHGLVQVPEGREILARLTVAENLDLGGWARHDPRGLADDISAVMDRFPILRERRASAAGSLSGGEQQMLAIARALVARPRLLLLDEPSLGLAPKLVEQIFALIEEIRAQGITVLLVEQNARRALELSDRAYVLETGRIVLSGTGDRLVRDPEVQRAYLGT